MNVSLTPQLERFVHKKVQVGRYNSASEVVREALRLLEDKDRLRQKRVEEIRRKIEEGWESLQRGEGVDGEEFFERLARRETKLERKRV